MSLPTNEELATALYGAPAQPTASKFVDRTVNEPAAMDPRLRKMYPKMAEELDRANRKRVAAARANPGRTLAPGQTASTAELTRESLRGSGSAQDVNGTPIAYRLPGASAEEVAWVSKLLGDAGLDSAKGQRIIDNFLVRQQQILAAQQKAQAAEDRLWETETIAALGEKGIAAADQAMKELDPELYRIFAAAHLTRNPTIANAFFKLAARRRGEEG